VLGAAYMLWLYKRVVFGRLEREELKSITDLNWREVAYMAPLVVIVFWMGIFPSSFLDVMHPAVQSLVEQHHAALAGGAQVADAAAAAAR
jgi:NADH-quinone oxidoreductase subunit M